MEPHLSGVKLPSLIPIGISAFHPDRYVDLKGILPTRRLDDPPDAC